MFYLLNLSAIFLRVNSHIAVSRDDKSMIEMFLNFDDHQLIFIVNGEKEGTIIINTSNKSYKAYINTVHQGTKISLL